MRSSPGDEIHIASVVVLADPARAIDIGLTLAALPGVEVHTRDPSGKFILIIEAESVGIIADSLELARLADGVYGASLVYHQADDRATFDEELTP